MQTHTAYRVSLAAGLAILALTILSSLQQPARPCGDLAAGYAPIIAFELARTTADLHALFGPADDACRAAMIASMDAINWLDLLIFIPLYGAFMAFFFLGMRSRAMHPARVGVALSLLAAAGDVIENLCLMQLTPQLDAHSFWFALLPWATGIKWLALGAAAAVAGFIFMRLPAGAASAIGYAAAFIGALVFVVTIAAIAQPPRFGPIMSPAIGASWLMYLTAAAVGARRAA